MFIECRSTACWLAIYRHFDFLDSILIAVYVFKLKLADISNAH